MGYTMKRTTKTHKLKRHKTFKNTNLLYDNNYIIVKPYFPDKDDIYFNFEPIFKKYNLSSYKYIDNVIKEDYKLLKSKNIIDSTHIKQSTLKSLNPINKQNLKPLILFYDIMYRNLNPRYFGIKALLSNHLNKKKVDVIEDKTKLYIGFKNYNEKLSVKYLPQTFNITEFEKYKFGTTDKKYYILKPVVSYGGFDIIYVESKEDLENAIEYYNTHFDFRKKYYGSNVVAQEYIIKPLLFYKSKSNDKSNTRDTLGYKCHFRANYSYSYIKGKPNTVLLNDIKIYIAKEPYSTDVPFRKEVHDSHLKSTDDDFFLEKNYEQLHITIIQRDYIIREFNKIANILENIMKRDTIEWLHPEHQNGFEMLGIDFMVEDNRLLNHSLDVKLIEVNTVPGFSFIHKQNKYYNTQLIYKQLEKQVFSKLF